MNLSFYIAKRYFFAKKSHNAIHIISLVTVCGVAIATMATVCTLSVFNGFRGLVAEMFSSFDPVLKITPVKGKVFDPSTEKFLEIYSLDAVDCISESLEDNALVKYKERQVPVVLKGVSDNFGEWTKISDVLVDGEFRLEDDTHDVAVLGIGVAAHLGLNVPFIFPLDIYAPRRNVPVNLSHPVSS
ncbi:MAG: ABC transporter permease, partial [Dysgonamonadaceae bacterium]|nr:ABC transporter permease [Dysgonamonadaceae bacterium]